MPRREILGFSALFVIQFFLWLGLAGQVSTAEVVLGAGVDTLAVVLAVAVSRRGRFYYELRARWFKEALGLLPQLVSDCALVFRPLASGAFWRLKGEPDRLGHHLVVDIPGRPGPDDRNRIALGIIGSSLTPNVFVVDVDEERRLLLIHELVPDPSKQGAEKLWWPT